MDAKIHDLIQTCQTTLEYLTSKLTRYAHVHNKPLDYGLYMYEAKAGVRYSLFVEVDLANHFLMPEGETEKPIYTCIPIGELTISNI